MFTRGEGYVQGLVVRGRLDLGGAYDAAAQRVDPDLVLDYICEPLPAPDQL